MKLVKVVSQCRMQEMQVRALEQTLENHTKKLANEKKQQLHLQQQLQTVLHEKEEAQELTQKIKANLQREAPLAETAERALAENAEKLAKIDEEVMKIRGEAIDLVQMHQVRNEVQGQVEALCSRVTELEEKKTEALERMRSLLAEETMTSQNMKAAVTEVCTEQKEHAVEMDEKYHILWSNVEQLLGCCDKFLELTIPEVEALKLDAHQANESDRIQTFVSHSQVEIRDDHSEVVSAEAQSDVSEAHSPGQDVTHHEDFSQRVESLSISLIERDCDDNHIVSVDDGNQLDSENTEVHLEPITDEDQHERDAGADKQDLEFAEVQSVAKQTEIRVKHPLPNQTEVDPNTHSTLELLLESPSPVLTQNERSYKVTKNSTSPEFNGNDVTATSEIQLEHDISHADTSVNFVEVQCFPFSSRNQKCSSLNKELLITEIVLNGAVQASLSPTIVSQNNQTIANEETTPQVCNTVSTCTLTSNFSQPCVSHVSVSSTLDTLCVGSHIESRAANENTIPTHTEENQADEVSALALEVMKKGANIKQIEGSPSLSTHQKKSDSTTSACQGECMPNSTIIFSTEEDSSQVSSDNVALNNFPSASQTFTSTMVMPKECFSLTNKLSTTAPLHFTKTEESMVLLSSEKQHEEADELPDLDKQISFSISTNLVSDQMDKQPASSVSQMREHETLLSDSLQQDES
ncbi:uncharacterized protein LOC135106571 isoform X2 [Scylla paramamosain]